MSGVAALRALLTGSAALTAVVPATRIMAGVLPVATPLPAIAITEVSATDRLTVAMSEPKVLRTERVQVTVVAKSYPTVKSILLLVRSACVPTPAAAIVGNIDVDSIIPELEGPDFVDPESGVFMQPIDYMVRWQA